MSFSKFHQLFAGMGSYRGKDKPLGEKTEERNKKKSRSTWNSEQYAVVTFLPFAYEA